MDGITARRSAQLAAVSSNGAATTEDESDGNVAVTQLLQKVLLQRCKAMLGESNLAVRQVHKIASSLQEARNA